MVSGRGPRRWIAEHSLCFVLQVFGTVSEYPRGWIAVQNGDHKEVRVLALELYFCFQIHCRSSWPVVEITKLQNADHLCLCRLAAGSSVMTTS